MKVLELFSGNGDISKAFLERGHQVFRVDYNKDVIAESYQDISKMTIDDILKLCDGVPDIVWASPDCTTYSIATHKHRTKKEGLKPKTEYASVCDETNIHMWNLIDTLIRLGTKYYFVENPRGRMRLMPFVENRPMFTISYCSYGRDVMKPTDIWTNHKDPKFKPLCKERNGHHLPHKTAKSSYNKGGKNRYLLRGQIPKELCEHIVNICE